jgi:hypothetical protein
MDLSMLMNSPEMQGMVLNFIRENGILSKINTSVIDFHTKTAEENGYNFDNISFRTRVQYDIVERKGKKGKVKRVYVETWYVDAEKEEKLDEKPLKDILNNVFELISTMMGSNNEKK